MVKGRCLEGGDIFQVMMFKMVLKACGDELARNVVGRNNKYLIQVIDDEAYHEVVEWQVNGKDL